MLYILGNVGTYVCKLRNLRIYICIYIYMYIYNNIYIYIFSHDLVRHHQVDWIPQGETRSDLRLMSNRPRVQSKTQQNLLMAIMLSRNIWLVVYLLYPSDKYEFVNWDAYSKYCIWKIKHAPHHQQGNC